MNDTEKISKTNLWKKRFWISTISLGAILLIFSAFFTVRTITASKYIVSDADLMVLDYLDDDIATKFFLGAMPDGVNTDFMVYPDKLLDYGLGNNKDLYMKFSTVKHIDEEHTELGYERWKNVTIWFWPYGEDQHMSYGFSYEDSTEEL